MGGRENEMAEVQLRCRFDAGGLVSTSTAPELNDRRPRYAPMRYMDDQAVGVQTES